MRRFQLMLALALIAAPGAVQAQAVDPNTPVSSADAPAAAQSPATDAASGPGAVSEPFAGTLPERAAPPRTLRAYWYVFAAFTIVWLLVFGYALTVGRRFARLEEEVRRLGASA